MAKTKGSNEKKKQDKHNRKISPWPIIVKSDEYRAWKSAVRKAHGYKCVVCGKSKREFRRARFDCHHIKPKAQFPQDMFKVDNGMFLCQEHHIELHKKMKLQNPEYNTEQKASSSYLWKMVKQLSFKIYNRKRYRSRKTTKTKNKGKLGDS